MSSRRKKWRANKHKERGKRDECQRRRPCSPQKFPFMAIILPKVLPLLLLLIGGTCNAQQSGADFYGPSAANSYFWTAGFPGGGYGANSGSPPAVGLPNNPFTPQDFGGSSSDGFDAAFDRQPQQMGAFQVNGEGPSFLARPPASSPLDFQSAYGANNAGGDDQQQQQQQQQVAIDEEADDGSGGPTKFPTLIPQEKLATAGMTEPAVMVEDATEPSQQNWNGGGAGMGAGMDGNGVIKDVSMMRSVPAPPMPMSMGRPLNAGFGGFPQQFVGAGGDNVDPFFGPSNDCFGANSPQGGGGGPGCPPAAIEGGGGTYLSGDGSGAYQFPLPDEGQMMGGMGGQMGGNWGQMGGGMGSAQFQGNGFAGGQQLPIANGVNGFFPSPPFQQQNMMGGGGMDGGMFGGGGGNFGGFGAIGENMGGNNGDNEEDEEQEEFGGGGFVENGPMGAGMGGGGAFGMGGNGGGDGGGGGMGMGMVGDGGSSGMVNGNEQERYAQYLEMINRKYGIGMPANGDGGQMAAATFIGTNQIVGGNQQQMGSGAAQQIAALPPVTQTPFGIPPWGISPTAGGQPSGGGQGNGGGGQLISQQQMCRQMASTMGQPNQKQLPFECTNVGGNNIEANKENEEHQKQVEAVAAAILAAGDHQNKQQQSSHGENGAKSHQSIGSGNSIIGSVVHSAGQPHSTIAPSDLEPTSSTGSIGGEEEETTPKPNGLFGSAMLGRLIGSSLAKNAMGHSSVHSASSLHSYALSGARVPFPFGTAKERQGVGVDGGPWLPPAPSVASLKTKMPGAQSGDQGGNSSPPSEPHQQQRSIEAIQQQLLLALLSTQRPMPSDGPNKVEIRSTTAPMPINSDAMESETAAPAAPMQPSTTSVQALTQQIRRLPAVLYADSRLPSSQKLETLLREVYGLPLVTFYVDRIDGPEAVERNLEQLTAHRGLPYLFICGTFIGSTEHVQNYHEQRQMPKLVEFVCNGEAEKGTRKTSSMNSPTANRQQLMDEPQPRSGESRKKGRIGRQKKRGGGKERERRRQKMEANRKEERRRKGAAENERRKKAKCNENKNNNGTAKPQLSQRRKNAMQRRRT